MKNKIILGSIALSLIVLGFVGVSNADLENVTREDRAAHMEVIDKLIDGETLSGNEQVTLEEIREMRAEREVYREERQSRKEELAPIFEKKRLLEELSEEEQVKLDEFRAERQSEEKNLGFHRGGKGGKRGGGYGGGCSYSE